MLRAEGVNKYFGKKKILENICLRVEKGEIFGLIGASGAGKSTLFRCLSSLEEVSSGEIRLGGEKYPFGDKKSLGLVRRKIGMIFQHFYLLNSKSVRQNILLPLELRGETGDAEKLLKLVGLEGKGDYYPTQLSGGEKQRVAIARALAGNPDILFCDEATSALDPKTTGEILDLLQKLNEELDLTIVLITHEMDIVRKICHKVAVIDKGRIVEQGESLEVFANPKDPVTEGLLQNSVHELNLESLKKAHPDFLFLELHFKGKAAEQPILSHLIAELRIEVNILSGWIDSLRGVSLGSLTVGCKGDRLQEALTFLAESGITYKVLS